MQAGGGNDFPLAGKQQPNQINLVRFTKEGQSEIVMEGDSFMAPLEQGVYYYGVSAYWKSEDGMYSAGDTSSVFKIEVTAGNRK
ncbi:hypothetical protein J2Z22_002131 [Paenibacillus forsythiae]|uniref:Alginate lyase 2 domain-containing protein n=1 Tax=Paenibacillus forsythiae TaxID=365616 RepID=A0ABU3H7A4_9BACL|nr:hypothetical protein [Paenibacillus forsythiae]MDT3426605.1 hypothetical protein [Paenibacillus forsythiae]